MSLHFLIGEDLVVGTVECHSHDDVLLRDCVRRMQNAGQLKFHQFENTSKYPRKYFV